MRCFTSIKKVNRFVLVYKKRRFYLKKKDFTFLYIILIYKMNFT